MEEDTTVEVSLDTLNPKQKAKEYKNTYKEIKSKDIAIKIKALNKCKDCRYLTEGGCIMPLLDSVAVKKVPTDISKTTLDVFIQFLEASDPSVGGFTAAFTAMKYMYTLNGNLNHLQILTNLVIFKEEVKKVKKLSKKKGTADAIEETPPVVVENELVVNLRLNALRAIYNISLALSQSDSTDAQLLLAFSNIPNFVNNLCQMMMTDLATRFNAIETRPAMMQEGSWALKIMCVLLGGNEQVLHTAIASGLVDFLPIFSSESSFTILCIEFYKFMVNSDYGFETVTSVSNIASLMKLLDDATTIIEENTTAAAVTEATPSGGKKDDKKKGAAAAAAVAVVPEVNEASIVNHKHSILRVQLSYIKHISAIFITVAKRSVHALNEDMVTKLISCATKVILNKGIYEIISSKEIRADGMYLGDIVDICCVLFGTIASISEDHKRIVCDLNGIGTLCEILQHSNTIIGSHTDDMYKVKKLYDLRRVTDQVILYLIGTPKLLPTSSSDDDNDVAICRWKSCRRWETSNNSQLFASMQLLLSDHSDVDMSNRCMRIMCALLTSSTDCDAFVASMNIEPAAVTVISNFVETRAASYIGSITVAGPAIGDATTRDTTTGDTYADVLTPSVGESLYMGLAVLEILLKGSSSHINVFGTAERIEVLAKALYVSGPCGCCSSNKNESVVTLVDPRSYPFTFKDTDSCSTTTNVNDVEQIRPVIFDVLSMVAAADSAYRTFPDAVLPVEPGGAMPAMKSPCLDASLYVAKLCADVSCSTVLSHMTYACYSNRVAVDPKYHPGVTVVKSNVLNAALKLLQSISGGGLLSIAGILESLVEAEVKATATATAASSNMCTSLSLLKQFLSSQVPEGDALLDTISHPYTWTRPVYFDDVFPEDTDFSNVATAATLIHSKQLWPFISVCSSLLGIISNPCISLHAFKVAFDTIRNLCRVNVLCASNQAVLSDIYSTVFVNLGALVVLSGAFGRYRFASLLTVKEASDGSSFMQYLAGRGSNRECFWNQWAINKQLADESTAAVAVDPKAKGKDPKADAKKDAKGAAAVGNTSQANASTVVSDVNLLVLPDTTIDPNHGPSAKLWSSLLELSFFDRFTRNGAATALTTSIQTNVTDLFLELVRLRVDVNTCDAMGKVPIMYALAIGNGVVIDALITAGANLDALDNEGYPVIGYACLSLCSDTASAIPTGPYLNHYSDVETLHCTGEPLFLDSLLSSKIDLAVCDAAGNSVLLTCMGLGQIGISIGGYDVIISSNSYKSGCNSVSPLSYVMKLVDAGALVNFSNRIGVVPIHIAAAQGDVDLIYYLIQQSAIPVAIDNDGFMPLHYVTAACPTNAIKAFDLLMDLSPNTTVQIMQFTDGRTGKSKEEKYIFDVNDAMTKILSDALCPSVIRQPRTSSSDLLLSRSNDGLNIIHLLLSAPYIDLKFIKNFICGGKADRMAMLVHILSKHCLDGKVYSSLIVSKDKFNMSVTHALSLLLYGEEPLVQLSEAQRRSKKVKYYESIELQILDMVYNLSNVDFDWTDVVCYRELYGTYSVITDSTSPVGWTPIHGCIIGSSMTYLNRLLRNMSIDSSTYIHFIASLDTATHPLNVDMLELLVAQATLHKNCRSMLNAYVAEYGGTPLHMAVRRQCVPLIRILVQKMQVDLNAVDEVTKETAVFEACKCNDGDGVIAYELLRAFAPAFDRIDLLIGNGHDGKTCIDYLVEHGRVNILSLLLEHKRNDIIERVLQVHPDTKTSILMQIEIENIRCARCVGIYDSNSSSTDTLTLPRIDGDVTTDNTAAIALNADATATATTVDVIDNTVAVAVAMEPSITGFEYSAAKADILLYKSEMVARLLVQAVRDADVIGRDAHVHDCFFHGLTYSQHCLGYDLYDQSPMNHAFVFIKPHAHTEHVKALVQSTFKYNGIRVISDGILTGEEIDDGKLIDQHYYAIASKATLVKPVDMPVPKDKFYDNFGITFDDALAQNIVFNALDACTYLQVESIVLNEAWLKAKLVKLGGGFYVGLCEVEDKTPIYVFNAFFLQMRNKFVTPGTSIYYYSVEWSSNTLSWADFRGKVLGPTDPALAPAGSLRNGIYVNWESLGLHGVPNVGDNGVHASASPFEGLAERMNWLKVDPSNDPFGCRLLNEIGMSVDHIKEWSIDPQIKGKSLFDQLEDRDADECIEIIQSLLIE